MIARPSSLPAARVLGALVALAGTPARADGYLVLEAPAAMAVSDPQARLFRAGLMPAIGLYADNGTAALGLRLRGGLLRNGAPPDGHLADPGYGGLATGGLALRLAAGGLWLEAVVGGGLTGRDLVPAVEAGIGWDVGVGGVAVGPSARYVRVVSRDPMAALGSANLVLVGIDVRFGARPPARVAAARIAEPPAAVAELAPIASDRDPDRLVEREASCADDLDGCEIAPQVFVQSDRIVLDDRVLFDLDRARVKSAGRALIAQIVTVWRAHPAWKRLTIEGHADVRGTDDYNLALSQRRAERVRDVFVRLGVAAEQLDAVGYGRSRPRDPGTSEAAHQHNRRVEFVIEREPATAGDGGAP
jgi:outer membrane protein OmpA-like peptidoglycan-associated protein